jgi:2-iminobutanoate/2-iminopropanoate deaminase
MNPTSITNDLPHPPFCYSQATKVGNLIFVAGQSGMNFTTGNIADDFETQARQAFENLKIVLAAASCSMQQVAKTTVWLCDAANFDTLNKLYAEYFPINPPARSTPVVNLPKANLLISIEAIAVIE